MFVVEGVSFDDEHLALVVRNPSLVSVVQIAEVLDADSFFVFTSALLDL